MNIIILILYSLAIREATELSFAISYANIEGTNLLQKKKKLLVSFL